METLNLSGTAPRSESRLKALFWPSIQTSSDVDYLGAQGYWICTIIAVHSCLMAIMTGNPILAFGALAFYYLGGVGVRQHDVFSSVVVFIMFVGGALKSPGVLVFFGFILLLSNVRATFIASFWEKGYTEAEPPVRFNDTWTDKFVDVLPAWLWPKIRIAYYIFSVGFLLLIMLGLAMVAVRRHVL